MCSDLLPVEIAQPKPIRRVTPLNVPVVFKESIKFFSVNLGPRKLELFPESPGCADLKTLLNQKENKPMASSKSFVQSPTISNKAALAKEKSKKLGLTFVRPQQGGEKGVSVGSISSISEIPGKISSTSQLTGATKQADLSNQSNVGEQALITSSSRHHDNIAPDSLQELPSDIPDGPMERDSSIGLQTPVVSLDRGNSDAWRRALMEDYWSTQKAVTRHLGSSISTVQELCSFEELSEAEDRLDTCTSPE